MWKAKLAQAVHLLLFLKFNVSNVILIFLSYNIDMQKGGIGKYEKIF